MSHKAPPSPNINFIWSNRFNSIFAYKNALFMLWVSPERYIIFSHHFVLHRGKSSTYVCKFKAEMLELTCAAYVQFYNVQLYYTSLKNQSFDWDASLILAQCYLLLLHSLLHSQIVGFSFDYQMLKKGRMEGNLHANHMTFHYYSLAKALSDENSFFRDYCKVQCYQIQNIFKADSWYHDIE